MNLLRNAVDVWYLRNRAKLFAKTEQDPEQAHERFVRLARRIHRFRLERLLLDCSENRRSPGFVIRNAAGFNKNGTIPPTFLRYLGFDGVVVGTVTGDPWPGNPKTPEEPYRVRRYPETHSMVNWLGLPGVGAERVAENLSSFGNHGVPITINLMAPPGKQGDEVLADLTKTIKATKDLHFVTTYELNISCPNTHGSSGGIDARVEHQKHLDSMLRAVYDSLKEGRDVETTPPLYIKVSPDTDLQGVRDIIAVCKNHVVTGFTTTNTTRVHDLRFITSPPNSTGQGGASGRAVYNGAFAVQKMFADEFKAQELGYKLIACGGIESPGHAIERVTSDKYTSEVQVFTPLIFQGPRLLRELRRASQVEHTFFSTREEHPDFSVGDSN